MGTVAARKLGDRIRAERIRIGITQMDFAHLAGMNVANVGRIERGDGNPTLESIVRIAGVLDVPVTELVAGIDGGDVPAGRHRYTAADFLQERARRGD